MGIGFVRVIAINSQHRLTVTEKLSRRKNFTYFEEQISYNEGIKRILSM